uniref:C1q domain-containing protein n=1 Tax=Magallana gigas TaxID=29159 RepID=A0A8W8LVC3_MAGGI
MFVSGTAPDTPQQVVMKYNNYKTICTGLGYKATQCNGEQREILGFQASMKNNLENMKTRETVIFNQVSLNEGKAYDTNSGKFTAPIDGVYFFSWGILTDNGKYFVTEIVRNSIPVAYNYTDGRGRQRGAGNIMTSSNALIKMKKGDEVWIRTYLNYGQLGRCEQWCYFSGFKL